MKIGVLALQGDFRGTASASRNSGLMSLGGCRHLEGLRGLIIPAESTAIGKLLVAFDLIEPLRAFG